MDLSIVIVNWNTKGLLTDCLNSILDSKPKMSYEVIVVDNGSEDGSVEAIAKFKTKLKLKVIENKSNEGYSKANNKGIRDAVGDYILLLNTDTKVVDSALDRLFNFAKDHPDAGVVGARLLNADGSLQTSCFKFPTLMSAMKEYWFGIKGSYGSYVPSGETPTAVDVVVGAAFLITPEARKRAGILNEKYFFFFEDLDYCRKVKSVGLKVYYLPEAKVIHYHGSTIRKTADADKVWKKLVPGSKIYHGLAMHYLINFVLWSGQKWRKLLNLE